MNILGIKETCIYVTDLQRTKEFYVDLLGLHLISLVEGRHVFFRAGTSVLLCFIGEKTLQESELPPHGATGVIHFAFEVAKEDYGNALEKIRSVSIPVLHEQVWKSGLKSFYFHDPDGHLVEIIEAGLWESS